MLDKFELILASASPRRSELLGHLNIDFKVHISHVKEECEFTKASDVVQELARIKAYDIYESIKDKYENPLVVGADTVVVYNNEILGKPKTKKEAKETLDKLSGTRHEVLTGVSIVSADIKAQFYRKTFVQFKDLAQEEIDIYLKSDDCMDKAGSYGIQGQAQIFIDSIEGSYSNVVGFPIADFIVEMKKLLRVSNLSSSFRNLNL